jgi:UDP-N-acetylmuramoylalanine--D-glutamate ligase
VLNAADPLLSSQFRDRDPVSWFNAPGTIRVDGGGLYHGEAALDLVLPEGLPGAHNLSNVAAALTVVKLAGLDVGRAAAAVSEFHALPHRLQLLGERNGVRFVNDSISSTPVATVAALEAYRRESVVLLVGGLDRGLDWSPYMADFQSFLPRAVIALPDNGPQILDEMRRAGLEPPEGLHAVADLEQGTGLAAKVARNGDVVLLSPGAPSFPKFRDYRDRGNRFARFCGFEGVE